MSRQGAAPAAALPALATGASGPVAQTMTKAEFAAHMLRNRIRSGELAPGERVAVEHLKHELAMSPTPIREALRVLQSDGLVEYRPHHGIFVATLSADDVEEIFRLRVALEPMAIERAVRQMDEPTLAELERIHAELLDASAREAPGEVADHNSRWHWTLYRSARSPRLEDYIERLWEAFPWRLFGSLPGGTEHTVTEHSAIQEAVRAGDAERAAELLGAHINGGREMLLRRLREVDQTGRG